MESQAKAPAVGAMAGAWAGCRVRVSPSLDAAGAGAGAGAKQNALTVESVFRATMSVTPDGRISGWIADTVGNLTMRGRVDAAENAEGGRAVVIDAAYDDCGGVPGAMFRAASHGVARTRLAGWVTGTAVGGEWWQWSAGVVSKGMFLMWPNDAPGVSSRRSLADDAHCDISGPVLRWRNSLFVSSSARFVDPPPVSARAESVGASPRLRAFVVERRFRRASPAARERAGSGALARSGTRGTERGSREAARPTVLGLGPARPFRGHGGVLQRPGDRGWDHGDGQSRGTRARVIRTPPLVSLEAATAPSSPPRSRSSLAHSCAIFLLTIPIWSSDTPADRPLLARSRRDGSGRRTRCSGTTTG
eukprot:23166-Pelagococcus_subviridis.AAC.2